MLTYIAAGVLVLGFIFWAVGFMRLRKKRPSLMVPIALADQNEYRHLSDDRQALKALRRQYDLTIPQARQTLEAIRSNRPVPSNWSQVDVPMQPEECSKIVGMYEEGHRVEALRFVRQETNLSLLQARDLLESLR